MIAGAVIAAAAGAAALPSLARPLLTGDLTDRAPFERVDANRDGLITPGEYRAAPR